MGVELKVKCGFIIVLNAIMLVGCGKLTIEDAQPTLTSKNTTLDKIRATNTLVVGFHDRPAPFSYVPNGSATPIGYAIDIENHLINAVKLAVNMPNLDVQWKRIEASERINAVKTGMVDFECSTMTNTLARQQEVSFSMGFFVVTSSFLVHKNQNFTGYQDLNNQKVGVVKNSVSEKTLHDYVKNHATKIKIVQIDSENIENALQTGMVDMLFSDDVLLASNRMNLKKPDEWQIVGEPNNYEIYSCTLRKNDDAFKKVIDNSLLDLYATGKIYQMYDKWFKTPLLKLGKNLNYSLSVENAKLFAKPYDTPVPSDISKATQNISKGFKTD